MGLRNLNERSAEGDIGRESQGEKEGERLEHSPEANENSERSEENDLEPRLPNVFWALAPILCMAFLMLYVFGWAADSDGYDAAHMPLLCSTVIACAVGVAYGRSFKYMLEGILDRLLVSMEAILILLLVGLLISSFMVSGTIPALIYYVRYVIPSTCRVRSLLRRRDNLQSYFQSVFNHSMKFSSGLPVRSACVCP